MLLKESITAAIDTGLGQGFRYRERDDDGELGELVIRYHRDLDGRRWENQDEVYGNGLDDDGNGYVDDRYGYDFYYDTGDTTSIRSPETNRHGMNMGRVVANTREVCEKLKTWVMKNEERIVELLSEILQRLDQHTERLDQHTEGFTKITAILEKHSAIFEGILIKLDTLIEHEKRIGRLEDKVFGH